MRQLSVLPLSLMAGCWLDGPGACDPTHGQSFERVELGTFGDDAEVEVGDEVEADVEPDVEAEVDVEVCGDGHLWAGSHWELESHADGRLTLDTDGRVYIDGGSPAWGEVEITGFGPFSVGRGPAPTVATSEARIVGNLDAEQAIHAAPFDPSDAISTSDYGMALEVIGPDGRRHAMEVFFKKTQPVPQSAWTFHVTVRRADGDGGWTRHELGRGELRFDPLGGLAAASGTTVQAPWVLVGAETVALDFGTPISEGGTGLEGFTSEAGVSTVTRIEHDGADPSPELSIELTSHGDVITTYADGRERVWGRLLDGPDAELRLRD